MTVRESVGVLNASLASLASRGERRHRVTPPGPRREEEGGRRKEKLISSVLLHRRNMLLITFESNIDPTPS